MSTISIYQQILAQQPNHADALHLLGLIAGMAGRLDVAEELIGKAIAVAPTHLMFYRNLGQLLLRAGQAQRAGEWHALEVQANPHSSDAWFDLAMIWEAQGQTEKAIEPYGRALQLAPAHTLALNNLGLILKAKGRVAEARECYERALAVDPTMIEARGNLGVLLESQGQYAAAIEHYRVALQASPDHYMLHYNLGVSTAELGRKEEAVAAYQRSIVLNPNYAPAHNNLGNVLKMMGRFEEAMAAYHRALGLEPNLAEAYSNLAAILESRAEHAAALACHRNAVGAQAAELRAWNQRHAVPLRGVRRPHVGVVQDPERRLRIGYLSPDLRDHVIARNMLPAFRERDRAGFEVFCYSSLVVPDAMTGHLRQLSDQWRDVAAMEDARLAEQIRADGIDILVDLSLHMAGTRLLVLAHKPAPVQATFAGYPGSTGLETIDYRFTDGYLEPPEKEGTFVEKSMRLASFWCYDPVGIDVAVNELPAAEKGTVTFGCLNHFCKVNDGVLDRWIAVMQAVPESRLMLLCAEGSHRGRTADYFAARGIAAERIAFFAARPRLDYLALYHQVDMGLDTLPYNGHTTSLDAMWMGVPVLTEVGRTEVGRAGLSQLTNLGMPELITWGREEFVKKAVELAGDWERLKAYRATLRPRMERSVLMDGKAFTHGLEGAYRQMWREFCTKQTGR